MTSYSIAGYSLALRLRSAKTILVEGPSDKRVLSRLVLHHVGSSSAGCVIDDVAIVSSDPALAGMGCKQKVQFVASSLRTLAPKLNWLVDREWDDIDLKNIPLEYKPVQGGSWGSCTKGHSIENYWLREEILADYLKMFFGCSLPWIYRRNILMY